MSRWGSWRLLAFLLERARGTVALLIGAGLIAGLCSVALLALISRALTSADAINGWLVAAFAALTLGKLLSTLAGQLLLVRFSQGTILELSLALARRVLDAPLRTVERRGSAQLLTTMTDDVSAVTWAVQCVPQLAMNAAIVMGCGLYLAWLSWPLFLAMGTAIVLGAVVYWWQHTRAFTVIHRAREERAALFDHYRSLTAGLKELMLNRRRREDFLERDVNTAADAYRRSNLSATTHYALAEIWVQLLYHTLTGIVLFGAPLVLRPSAEVLTAYVFALLYLMAPLWAIIGTVPAVARGQVAIASIEQLGVALRPNGPIEIASQVNPSTRPPPLQLRGVQFRYDTNRGDTNAFRFGPVDLDLQPGELLFVAGGNGSGKSTFVKVLCGLYLPESGEIEMDGILVTESTQGRYRELFSAVFSDFHLFRSLHGIDPGRAQTDGIGYLRKLGLESQVALQDGHFSTVDLSQGQRKRLALLVSYLEDRPIVIFDEWAADQDPEYKRIFYTQLLPELRARGKTVVVITHDDRYFHLGDRVLKLEDGQVASLGPPQPA